MATLMIANGTWLLDLVGLLVARVWFKQNIYCQFTTAIIMQQLVKGCAVVSMADDENLFDAIRPAHNFYNSVGTGLVS